MTYVQHKRLYWLFLILGLLGLLEIATSGQIPPFEDLGLASIIVMTPFTVLLGSGAAVIGVFANLIFSLSIIWLGIAWYEHWHMKKLQKEAVNKKTASLK